MRQAGWSASVDAYTGYGTEQQLRVLARVILTPSRTQLFDAADEFLNRRGWRNFISAPAVHHQVTLVVNGEEINLTTDREGYIDIRIKNPGLEPGWQSVDFIVDDAQPVPAPIQIVSSEITFGIISDIDDTIISTLLPRPFIAAWNSFVLTERARQPVVGMSKLYKDLLAKYPGAPIIYISTG
ncbi:MAG: ABC transporter ATP-binding protein, partial [Propionibacterium sp.]